MNLASLLLCLQAQGVPSWLPEDVFLYVRVAALTRAADEARTTAPYRAWQDPDLADDLDTLHAVLRHRTDATLAADAAGWLDRMRDLFRGPAHLALRRSDGVVRWTLVFEGLTLPADRTNNEDLAERIRHGRLASFLRGAPVAETRAGIPVLRFPHPAAEPCCALRGSTWILSDDPTLWAAVAGGPRRAGALAHARGFRRALAAVGADDPTLFAFFDPDALVRGRSTERAERLGLAAVRGVGLSLALRDGRVVDRVHVDTPGGLEQLLPGLRGGPTRAAAAAAAPPGTMLMATLPLDPVRLHAGLEHAALEPPDSVFRRIHDALYGGIGLRVSDEMLQALGQEITFLVIVPDGGTLIPELGAVLEVRNADAVAAAMPRVLQQQLGLTLRTLPFAGHTIHYGLGDHLGMVVHAALPPVYPAPAYAVAHGRLLMGMRPITVKRLLRALDGDGPSLRQDPRFAATVTEAMASLAPAGLIYCDTARTFDWLDGAGAWRRLWPQELERFPLYPEAIRRHLGSSLNALLLGANGAELRSFSQGTSLSMAAAVAGVAALATDLQDRVRGIGPDTAALHAQLSRVGRALAMCRARDGAFPRGLAPVLQRLPAAERDALPELQWHLPDPPGVPAPGTIVVAPVASGPRGCRLFVRADGSVDWLPEAEFHAALARPTSRR